MSTRNLRRLCAAVAVTLAVMLCGCEDDASDTSTATVDITGNWNYSDSTGLQSTLVLVQTDSSVSGASTDAATITGVVSDDTVGLTLSYSDGSYTYLDGTASTTMMSGTLSGNATTNGTWTAVKTN